MIKDDELSRLRAQVDEIDEQLVKILNDRASVALAIGEVKGARPAYDPLREEQVLTHVAEINNGPLGDQDVQDVMMNVIHACRQIQIDTADDDSDTESNNGLLQALESA